MASRKNRAPMVPATALLVALLTAVSGFADEPAVAPDPTAADRLFTLRVLPLLKDKCFGCHGSDPAEIRGDLNMLTRDGLLAGGESGEASIVPGQPEESLLYLAVRWEVYEMPPKENDRLNEAEIQAIHDWIAAGAAWPDETVQEQIRQQEWAVETTADGKIVRTSGGTSPEWTNRRYQPDDLWAFARLPAKSELLPEGLADADAIDHFIDKQLTAAGIAPAAQATPQTLIRRVTLDLTGLPPTPAEIDEFQQAWSADAKAAWSALIDRLLSSPRYGERWARHWLDVTRYADTGGMSNDYERSNMWRYRDYVIRAFNDDKPYNEFVVEQLAGDELADESVLARKGDPQAVLQTQQKGDYTDQEAEWIVATGFLRLGPWDNAMVEADEARQMYLDDLVNITGQTFLATTMRCCKCHDHKFDPLPTRDYYRMYAAFSTTHMAERPVPLLSAESRDGFEEGQAHVQRMLAFAVQERDRLIDKQETAAKAWFAARNLPYKNEQQRRDLPDEEKPERHIGLDHVEQGQLKVREQDVWIWTRRLERYEPMAQSVYNAQAVKLAGNAARKLRITRNQPNADPPQNYILTGGALTAKGDPVQPGVLSAVPVPVNPTAEDPWLLSDAVSGRRLQLARWIADPNNGLAIRTIVNRVWQGHFGVGLAANANNFGAKGAKPSHPELLDYLAADFVQHGFSIKHLHRRILQSDAYQRSALAADPAQVQQHDPNNRLLSYFPRRRLSAEEIRDGILAITGELQESAGGVPVKPEINLEVALQPRMIQFSLAPAYQPSRTPEQRNCRTIYAYHVRGQADPFTELFNQPNPNESCEVRETAAVTPQVFTLLNSDMIVDRSIALALRLQQERDKLSEQVNRAFRLVLGRSASSQELDWLTNYVRDMQTYHSEVAAEPVSYPVRITRSLVEEFSGQPFEYEEILPVFEQYQADRKPADVSAEARALADMCLVLLNSNEFLYVD